MRIHFSGSAMGLRSEFRPRHGPQVWPWWRLFALGLVRLSGIHPPSAGWRLWIYTRWGAVFGDVYLDRRPRPL